MSFENVETRYLNWAPVPTGGISSKGPLNHLNVADGVGGWLDSNANINPANQHMGNINQITNVGNATDMQLSTDGFIRLDAPSGLEVGAALGTVNYILPSSAPTVIGQTLVAQSTGPSSTIAWSNTTLGTSTTATVNFLDSASLISVLTTDTLTFSRIGNLVICGYPGNITAVFSAAGSYMTSNNVAFIPAGYRPINNCVSPFLYQSTAGGPNNYTNHTIEFFSTGAINIVGSNANADNNLTGENDGWDISGSTALLPPQYFMWVGA